MKKILSIIVVALLVVTLSGCGLFVVPRVDETVNVDFYDVLGDLEDRQVTLHYFDKEDVAYIDLETYFDISASILDRDSITIDETSDGYRITYVDDFVSSAMIVTYSYDSQTLVLNHIESLDFMDDLIDTYPEFYYLTDYFDPQLLDLSDYVTLDLELYHMGAVESDGTYYFPFELCNLLFSSANTYLYFNGEAIYSTDDYTWWQEDFISVGYNYVDMPMDLQEHSMYFLAFYLDYFYGLNYLTDPNYFLNLIEDDYLEQLDGDTQVFYETVNYMFYDLNDLHAWMDFEGVYGDMYDFDMTDYTYSGRHLIDETFMEQNEDYCSNIVSSQMTPSITRLVIPEFSDFTAETFAYEYDLLVTDTTTDIVLDLSCNPGGYIMSLMDLLPYFYDGSFTIYMENYEYGSSYQYTFDSNIEAITENVYILTSSGTYSAANILSAQLQSDGIATVIGQNSLGGSSQVDVLVAPGGMLLTVPTLTHYTNASGDSFEMGVPVDYIIDYEDDNAIIALIESLR
jgi:hypothetical protein